jgi:Fic family protein
LGYDKRMEEHNFILKLARFHIEFEGIHSFIDGNDRMGCLLVNLELMTAEYTSIEIKLTDRMDIW